MRKYQDVTKTLQWDCCGTAVRIAVGHGQAVATRLPVETAAAGPLLWRCRCGAAVVGLQWDCCGTAVRVAVGHVQAVATELAERLPAILGFLRASAVELVPGGCCRKGAAGRLLLGGCCCEAAAGRLLETAARAQYA